MTFDYDLDPSELVYATARRALRMGAPDAVEINALTQGLALDRRLEAVAPRAVPPIGETEDVPRRLGLRLGRLTSARLAIPPHDSK